MKLGMCICLFSLFSAQGSFAQSDRLIQSQPMPPRGLDQSSTDGNRSIVPKQATDLDTFKLASAHRERSESIQERTNGLWQSWIVSICEGCGPEKTSYKNNDMYRNAAREALASQSRSKQDRNRMISQVRRKDTSLYADLATENIDQIRRSP